MNYKEFIKLHKEKIVIIAGAVLVVIVAVVLIWVLVFRGKDSDSGFPGMGGGQNLSFDTENMVVASGITSAGMIQEVFEVEGMTEGLLVEEIYIASGDEVQQGDKVLKLSEDSVAEAREELAQLCREADLAYRAGGIEYEQSLIEAKYNKDAAILQGEQAKEVYNETIVSLSDSVEQAEEKLNESKDEIAEYQEMIDKGYYEYYKVGEYQALYDENLDLLEELMERWGASWSQVTGQGGSSGNMTRGSGNSDDVSGGNADTSDKKATADSYQLSVMQSLYRILEDNLKDCESAQEQYEEAVRSAELEKQMLEFGLSALESDLVDAKAKYETNLLQAELTYEQSLAAAERAESDYEAEVEKAEADYESLKDAKEAADENLALFEELVGDGYYYAAESGTVLRTALRTNRYMTEDSVIFMYNNPEEMTVSVSVGQSDIDKLSVGDMAYIQSEEAGNFEGVVTEINPVSGSDSRTNVSYTVTVNLTVDSGQLSTNETVTVLFGAGGSSDENEEEN